jgi:porphobilinogen synthase
MRAMVAENQFTVHDLVWPVFVQEGRDMITPIEAMPGVERYSIDQLIPRVTEARNLGIPAIAIFPVVEQAKKSERAVEAHNAENLICRAIAEVKAKVPGIGVITDVALDPYTTHGHDGVLENNVILNDPTLELLAKQAVNQARAGSDVVAPSDMMDGRVGAIRAALDAEGFENTSILSYAVKYASSFYGPFREAVGSAENLGQADKRTYQMDPANGDEALREVAQDAFEGADMIMVKPGLPYLDVIRRVHESYALPLFAYQVSGEYAMIKAAAEKGWVREYPVLMEHLMAFKRAGANGIFTYAAINVARFLEAHMNARGDFWK